MSSIFSPVSFLVVTYNQEKYVKKAVESALNQQCFPLEIVITDDHSTDKTFEIIKEVIQKYKGPHKVILNRNPKNIGIVPQTNMAVSLSSGELLVGMAGDDISLPDRARRSYEEWCKSGKTAHSIFFNAQIISETGEETGIKFVDSFRKNSLNNYDLIITGGKPWEIRPVTFPESVFNTWVLGATHTFSRKSFDVFGQLRSDLTAEDHAIPYRSLILGEVKYFHEDMLLYRRHPKNYWPDDISKKMEKRIANRELQNAVSTHQQAIQDLNIAVKNNLIEKPLAKKIQAHCRKVIVNKGLNQAVYGDNPLQGLWRFFRGDLFEERRAQYYVILLKMTFEKAFRFKGFHLLWKLFGLSR